MPSQSVSAAAVWPLPEMSSSSPSTVSSALVRPEDIRTSALLTVEGELDDISGSGQTAAALTLCDGIPKQRKRHYEVKGAGHYGIFSGRRWREFAYPEIRDFIATHQK